MASRAFPYSGFTIITSRMAALRDSRTAAELASAEILGREIPFLFAQGRTVLRGTMDLLYRKDGRVVVADYKTDALDEASKITLLKKYRKQGEFYISAVEKFLKINGVEFRVIFLRQP